MANPPLSEQLSTTAKVLIVVGIAIATLPFVYFAMVTFAIQEHSVEDCRSQLRNIGVRCREYARDHEGQFPDQWHQLDWDTSNGMDTTAWPHSFTCPTRGNPPGDWNRVDLWADYRLVAGLSTKDSTNTVLAIEPLSNHKDGANVLFVDGRTAWWPASRVRSQGGAAEAP
jgi:prepilin-type processing-associated H-X9-DG protein